MADTTFVDFKEPAVVAAWLNDVNKFVYQGVPAPSFTAAQWLAAFGAQPLIAQTAAEVAAGAVPVNLTYPPGNAKRYGATGNGVTNDTSALQTWLNYCYSAQAAGYLPFGTYLCSGLTKTFPGNRLTQGLHLFGDGRNLSIIKQTGAPTDLIKFSGSNPSTGHNAAQIHLSGMTLQGITGAPTAFGLTLSGVSDFLVDNVTIEGFTRGANIEASLLGLITDSQISNCTNGIYTRRLGGTSAYCNAITARRVNVVGCSTFGLDIGEANMFLVDVCDIESCGTAANTATGAIMLRNTIATETGVGQFHMRDTWIEGNFGRGLQSESGGNMATGFTLSIKGGHILDQESGRAIVIAAARRVSIKDFESPSTNDTWTITCDQALLENTSVYTLTDSGITSPTYINVATNAGDKIDGQQGSFTATLTGCTTSPTITVSWWKQGKRVTLQWTIISATSNTTTATLTGMPANIRPSATRTVIGGCIDNGVSKASQISIDNAGVITLNNGFAAFTNSGTKGSEANHITYEM